MEKIAHIKILSFFIFVILPINFIMSQERYSVFTFKGNVLIYENNTEWNKIRKGYQLSLHDMINIPKEGNVSILDSKTSRIYNCFSEGIGSVKEIIETSENSSQSLTKALNKAIISKMSKKDIAGIRYTISGSVNRNNTNISKKTQSLCADMLYITSDQNISDKKSEKFDVTINWIGEKIFYLDITNNSNKMVFMNIINKVDNNIYFCINPINNEEFNVIIPAREQVSLKQYHFYHNTDSSYYVVLTNEDFNTQELQILLNKKLHNNLNCNNSVMTGIKLILD